MPTDEPFDSKKFFKGFIDPAMLRKVLPLMFWGGLVLLFCYGSALVAVKIHTIFFPKKIAETPKIENVSGGHIETQPDKRLKIGVFNF